MKRFFKEWGLMGLGLVVAGFWHWRGEAYVQQEMPSSPAILSLQDAKAEDYQVAWKYEREAYEELFNLIASEPAERLVLGGNAPHHLLAAEMVAKFYLGIAKQQPKTVVLIGPNHFNAGDQDILLSGLPWKTPYGVIEPDEGVIRKLEQSEEIGMEERVFAHEHAISNQMPFIKRVFSTAKVVPMIIKSDVNEAVLKELVTRLNRLVPDEAVLITSVDFSHYVSSKVAEEQDRVTIQALELERPTDKTAMRTDANEVLIVLKEWARLRGADEFQLQARADAGDFGEVDDPENITSYATFYYVNGID